jgi:hypothetical protein
MATITANGKYQYNCMFMGMSLDHWVQSVHKHNATINHWNYFPLKKGAFGYDNLAISIGDVFVNYSKLENILAETDLIDMLAETIHIGWTENYLYWRDHQPWLKNADYTKPAQSLGDARRNLCAETDFAQLPEDEKLKDISIAKFIYDSVKSIV